MIIVGLGNPGAEYENTFHNVGFMVVDRLAEKLKVTFKEKKGKAVCASLFKAGEKIVIAKPQTFMNLSGESVRELIGINKEELKNVIIIFDDIDIGVGEIRVRKEGSGGTHNGMKNIVALLNSEAMPRMRMGIGKPMEKMDLASYVLSTINGENRIKMDTSIEKAVDLLFKYITDGDLDKLMRDSKC